MCLHPVILFCSMGMQGTADTHIFPLHQSGKQQENPERYRRKSCKCRNISADNPCRIHSGQRINTIYLIHSQLNHSCHIRHIHILRPEGKQQRKGKDSHGTNQRKENDKYIFMFYPGTGRHNQCSQQRGCGQRNQRHKQDAYDCCRVKPGGRACHPAIQQTGGNHGQQGQHKRAHIHMEQTAYNDGEGSDRQRRKHIIIPCGK